MKVLDILRNNYSKHLSKIKNNNLINFKNKSLDKILTLGLPDYKNEEYKNFEFIKYYENPDINISSYQNYIIDLEKIFNCDVPNLNVFTLFTINGFYYKNNNISELERDGCKIKVVENENDLDYFKSINKNYDFLTELVNAFFNDIILIHIPQGVKLSKPLQIINLIYENYSLNSNVKFLIINDSIYENNIIFCDHSLGDNEYISGINVDVILNKGSKLKLYQLQNVHEKTFHFINLFVQQEENTKFRLVSTTLRAGIFRNNVRVSLNKQNSEANLYGLWLSDKEQICEYHTIIEHNSAYTNSDQLFKSILDDKATGIYNGKIIVKPNSQKVIGYQANRNLIISKDAKIKSLPHLEIFADDVKCSHGSATGKLNDDALFYLLSRGISHKEACVMLMEAFSSEIVNKIEVESLKNSVFHLIRKRLRGELEYCYRCDACRIE